MHRYSTFLLRILTSRKFFIGSLVLFVFEALWLALSYKYPMIWDEYYHFGLIQYYGHHINPIITNQPSSLDIYGNVARSPKYLYHYLMSFPYRLIALCTKDQVAQIISLRLLNITMFTGGLIAFRQAMLRVSHSRALVHLILLIIVLLPLSSLLAAQINYDNMEFLLSGLVFYWTFRFLQADKLEARWVLLVLGSGLLASVVKYTFLPILVAIIAVLLVWLWRHYHWDWPKLLWQSFRRLNRWAALGLVLFVAVTGALAIERFGINLIKYHSVDPNCAKVLSVERCMQFSPYKQQYTYIQEKQVAGYKPPHGIIGYTGYEWLRQLYDQYFTTGTQTAYEVFIVNGPLKIPFYSFLAVGAVGAVCFILATPRLLRRADVWIIIGSIIMLAAALFAVDYSQYTATGYPLAIQGRYLTPIIPLGLLLGGMAVSQVIRDRRVKALLTSVAVLGLAWGGGLTTHIVLSHHSWYWQNSVVVRVNDDIRSVLEPITL